MSCPVAVFLMHCGASVTTTNSSYVETYLANKAHSHSDSDSDSFFNLSVHLLSCHNVDMTLNTKHLWDVKLMDFSNEL